MKCTLEGFIPQVLGWREYIRGVCLIMPPEYSERNFFQHDRPLPDFLRNLGLQTLGRFGQLHSDSGAIIVGDGFTIAAIASVHLLVPSTFSTGTFSPDIETD